MDIDCHMSNSWLPSHFTLEGLYCTVSRTCPNAAMYLPYSENLAKKYGSYGTMLRGLSPANQRAINAAMNNGFQLIQTCPGEFVLAYSYIFTRDCIDVDKLGAIDENHTVTIVNFIYYIILKNIRFYADIMFASL